MMPSYSVGTYWRRRPAPAIVAGLCCTLLGLSVIIAWHLGLSGLIQIAHGYPMPYESAIGFLFVGIGLICVSAEWRTAARLAAIAVCTAVALDVVGVTIGANISLHRLLPPPEAGPLTGGGAPHIPPNAILNFTLTALALWFVTDRRPRPAIVALLGSIVAAIGLTSLFGYATRLDAAYAWRGLPPMSIHGATAFALIGLVLISVSWKQTMRPPGRLPTWLPIPSGMATGTATLVLWQALLQEDRSALAYSTLVTGGAFAVALALAIRFAQTASRALERAERTAQALNAEVLERRATEENLRKTEEDLTRAQQVARTGSWRLDVRRDELRWSAETYRMFGVAEGTPLTYETFLAAVHPEDRAKVDLAWRAALEGAPYDVEHRILVEGSVKWVRERARLEFDESGRLLGAFGTVQDITEQREAQQALWQSEARFRSMFESAAAGMAQVDLVTGRLLRVNHQLAVMTGYSEAELEGMSFLDLTHAEERSEAAAEFQRAASGEQREGYAVERRYVRKDGQEIFVDLHGSVVYDEHDQPSLGMLVMTDRTARKRAERALRESEQRVRRKLESVLSPDGDLGTLDLGDILDAPALQKVMDDFHGVTGIPMAVIDVAGQLLVGVGWQEICTRFHRVHPDSCRNCVESDTHLSAGLAKGEYRLYKCKNNLWDMATPIVVAGQHVGNVFTGQFFLAGEAVDRELFRAQARRYGFDEADYLAALDRVPRLTRETVDRGIAFFIKLADTLSQLGYTNVKLARLLAERDRLSDSLRESEEKLRNAFAHAAVGFAITTLDGRFVEANPAYCRLTGYDLEELRSIELPQLVHPDDALENRRLVGRMLAGDIDDFVVEHRYTRKTRGLVWVRTSKSLVRDAQGTPQWMIALVEDVTERRSAEEALRKSEARWNAAIEHLGQGVVVASEAGQLIYLNPAARAMHGFTSAAEGVGPFAEFQSTFQLWAPDGSRQLTVDEWPISRVLRGETVAPTELRLRRPDQSWEKFVSYSGAMVDTASGERLVHISLYDLTEQRRAEAALRRSEHFYRQTLESIPGMVFTTRPDGYCDYQSQQWVDFSGVAMSEHVGDGWNRLLHPDDRPRAFAAWRSAVEGRAPYDLEYRVRRYDGEYEWFKVRGAPIRDADGNIARWFGVAANIDALKQAEQDLAAAKVSAEHAKSVAEAANNTKDHFIAVLSHELRTPLMPVLSGITLLRRDPTLSAGAREVLDVLNRNVKAESRLIDDLLDLTRIERDKIELDCRRMDVSSIIDRAIEVCRPDLEARRLDLIVTCDRDKYLVDADAARLQQVLSNLLNNAIKFTPEGGSVSVRGQAQDGWVSIDVQDTGIGIEREAIGRIFGAFDQAERSITRRFGGLGLGLAISKAFVEMHGGTIEAQSDGLGKGSLFRIRLPLASDRALQPRGTAQGAPISRDGETLRPLHILLVEDHGDTADVLTALLERSGHRVTRAADVASALVAAGRDEFDFLVSDLGLPDGSGLDLMRKLRASGSTMPAIAVSGYGQASDVAQSRAAGFQLHLVKPIEPSLLFEAMERLMAKSTIV